MWVLVPSKMNLGSRLELALHIIPISQPKFLWMSLPHCLAVNSAL